MKKFKKVFFISVASLFLLVAIAISIALWLVFTPERITPIVRNQAKKFITCQSEIGKVELTFFSTFPHFGLKVNRFTLINPLANSPSDTLVSVDELTGVVDAAAWWKNKELVLTGFILSNGTIHAFTDALGNTNFDIVASDTTSHPETEAETMFSSIDISNIELNNINLQYIDLSAKLTAVVRDLTAKISGTIQEDHIVGNIKMDKSVISLEHNGEKYLQKAVASLNIPVEIIPSREFINLKDASASINALEIVLNGAIENDTLNRTIITDLRYQFKSWPIQEIIALIPLSYRSHVKGIDAEGFCHAADGYPFTSRKRKAYLYRFSTPYA
jgi:uncharacterized protein involved in outer membrane biogenesis